MELKYPLTYQFAKLNWSQALHSRWNVFLPKHLQTNILSDLFLVVVLAHKEWLAFCQRVQAVSEKSVETRLDPWDLMWHVYQSLCSPKQKKDTHTHIAWTSGEYFFCKTFCEVLVYFIVFFARATKWSHSNIFSQGTTEDTAKFSPAQLKWLVFGMDLVLWILLATRPKFQSDGPWARLVLFR